MAQTGNPVAELNQLIKGIEFAMLTTIRSNGTLHSCPMASQEVDADGVLWFLTDSNTEKAEAVRFNDHVNVAYADPGSQRYISVSGRCELARDQEKSGQLWKPRYKTWFPEGLDDPNLILLKVHVQEAEYWNDSERRMVELSGFPKVQ
jgi:general stress protein 26